MEDIKIKLNIGAAKWVPIMVVDNLAALAQEYPNGIPSDEILEVYRNKFGVVVDWKLLGFDSTSSFLSHCKSIVTKLKNGICMVYPKVWGLKRTDLSDKNLVNHPFSSPKQNYFWKPVLRDDICDNNFTYKDIDFPLNVKQLKVILADVVSPELFWLQDHEKWTTLTQMVYDMNVFYDEKEEDYVLDQNVLKAELACAVKYHLDNRWYRAKIIVVEDSNSVQLKYVDYGTVSNAFVSELRALHKDFSHHPPFAIKATMSGLLPFASSGYTTQACLYLFDLYHARSLYAIISKVNIKEPSVTVVLYDTNKDINVNELLVKHGFAKFSTHYAVPDKEHKSEICDHSNIKKLQEIITPKLYSIPDKEHKDEILDISNIKNVQETNIKFQSNGEPVILNESCVKEFYKLLPNWIYESSEGINSSVSNAKQAIEYCIKKKIESLNVENSPCCKKHLLFSIFKSNPNRMNTEWQKIMKKYSSQLEDEFLSNILEQIQAPHLKDKLMIRSCSSERKNKGETKDYTADNNEILKMLNSTDNSGRNEVKKHSLHCEDVYGDTKHEKAQNKPQKPKKRYIIEAVIMQKSLHLILYRNQVHVGYKELLSLFARGVPGNLISHRLQPHKAKFDFVVVERDDYPLLYMELRSCFWRIASHSSIVLLPLEKAGELLRTIAPFNETAPKILEMLAADCTSDHPNWERT